MPAKIYKRRPEQVEALEIRKDNLEECVEFAGESELITNKARDFIIIRKRFQAPGDIVVKFPTGYVDVYDPNVFDLMFEEVPCENS